MRLAAFAGEQKLLRQFLSLAGHGPGRFGEPVGHQDQRMGRKTEGDARQSLWTDGAPLDLIIRSPDSGSMGESMIAPPARAVKCLSVVCLGVVGETNDSNAALLFRCRFGRTSPERWGRFHSHADPRRSFPGRRRGPAKRRTKSQSRKDRRNPRNRLGSRRRFGRTSRARLRSRPQVTTALMVRSLKPVASGLSGARFATPSSLACGGTGCDIPAPATIAF